MNLPFRNRAEAGQQLAHKLSKYSKRSNVLVLALSLGGIRIGHEVAQRLDSPLDVFLTRPLNLPGQDNQSVGIIASGGGQLLDRTLIESLAIDRSELEAALARERELLGLDEQLLRGSRAPFQIAGRTVILIDESVGTAPPVNSAIAALRQLRPYRVVLAVPIVARSASADLIGADEVFALVTPDELGVGQDWFQEGDDPDEPRASELLYQDGERFNGVVA